MMMMHHVCVSETIHLLGCDLKRLSAKLNQSLITAVTLVPNLLVSHAAFVLISIIPVRNKGTSSCTQIQCHYPAGHVRRAHPVHGSDVFACGMRTMGKSVDRGGHLEADRKCQIQEKGEQ